MTAHDSGHFESVMQRLPEDDPIHEVHRTFWRCTTSCWPPFLVSRFRICPSWRFRTSNKVVPADHDVTRSRPSELRIQPAGRSAGAGVGPTDTPHPLINPGISDVGTGLCACPRQEWVLIISGKYGGGCSCGKIESSDFV